MSDAAGSRAREGDAVFISYRRGATSGQARALREHLVARVGRDRVFMDVDNIALGEDFVAQISLAIASSGVLLALIGKDWLTSETGERQFDNPEDFIRLELATAFERKVPVIPILVERTAMPSRVDLPEPLWPLLRRQALDLENNHWEYDVAKLMDAVTHWVGTSAHGLDAETAQHEMAEADEPAVTDGQTAAATDIAAMGAAQSGAATGIVAAEGAERARRRRGAWWRRPPALMAAGALAAAIAVVAIVATSGSKKQPPARVSSAALAVERAKPEALAQSLLYSPVLRQPPPGVSGVSTVAMLARRTRGLVAQIYLNLTGSDQYDLVYYNVFDNAADATTYFNGNLVDAGYQQSGSFALNAIHDPSRCFTEHLPASSTTQPVSSSLCFARSGYVVTGVATQRITSGAAGNTPLTRSLTQESVRRLARLAGAAGKPPAGRPLSPRTLASRLHSAGFTAAEMLSNGSSAILSTPINTVVPPGAGAPHGELSEISVKFSGPDKSDDIAYYVFATAADAVRWFAPGLEPTGTTVAGPIDSSGFSETTRCSTFNFSTPPPPGAATCYSLAGNVVVRTFTTTGNSAPVGNDDLTVTMQRMALFHLYRITGRQRS